jgi:flagellar basal-body rod modification protein FlgD
MALAATSSATSTTAQNAFGLEFQSLLRIILTQLTYQDPLKPLDNTEFVSQLAQFSQLQQTQSLSDQMGLLLNAQSATQATSLLGKTVEIATSGSNITGVVDSVSFTSNGPTVTVKTPNGQTISGLSIANVASVR